MVGCMNCKLLGTKRVWPNGRVIYSLSGETEENQAKAQSDSRCSERHSIRAALLLLLACPLGFSRDRCRASRLERWLLPRNGFGGNYIENTAPVILASCLLERVYLSTCFSGSICFEQTRHNIILHRALIFHTRIQKFRFESQTGHRMSWLRLMAIFLYPWQICWDSASIRPRKLPFKSFPIHQSLVCHPIIWRYVIWLHTAKKYHYLPSTYWKPK
jgi:hypothetical protein